jgi:hypothetical protein
MRQRHKRQKSDSDAEPDRSGQLPEYERGTGGGYRNKIRSEFIQAVDRLFPKLVEDIIQELVPLASNLSIPISTSYRDFCSQCELRVKLAGDALPELLLEASTYNELLTNWARENHLDFDWYLEVIHRRVVNRAYLLHFRDTIPSGPAEAESHDSRSEELKNNLSDQIELALIELDRDSARSHHFFEILAPPLEIDFRPWYFNVEDEADYRRALANRIDACADDYIQRVRKLAEDAGYKRVKKTRNRAVIEPRDRMAFYVLRRVKDLTISDAISEFQERFGTEKTLNAELSEAAAGKWVNNLERILN